MAIATTVMSAPRLLAASASPQTLTGSVAETTLATVSIPAGLMGLTGALEIVAVWSYTNNANVKTPRIRLGGLAGSAISAGNVTTTEVLHDLRRVRNKGVANAQALSQGANTTTPVGIGTGVYADLAVDTSVAQDLVFTGQLANAADSLVLRMYEVWLVP